jgi:hypothetical protein
MTIQVNWDNPQQTIINIIFQRGWTWAQLQAAIQRADDLIGNVPHPVHLLIDIREAGGLPGDFITRAGELFAQGEARPNEGRRIIVGAGPLIRVAYNTFLRIYGQRLNGRAFLFAGSVDEARAMIE